jgi:membrane protease YdiL (CAAX protease family)
MANIIDPITKPRKKRLIKGFLITVLLYHFTTIPSLIIYSPEKTDSPPLLTFIYKKIQSSYLQAINSFVDDAYILKIAKRSEAARSIMLILSNSVFLFTPMLYYKKNTIKYYIMQKRAKNITVFEKLLFAIILATIFLNNIIISNYFSPRNLLPQLPPFYLKYTIFWFRYIFISCFLGPISEELLFRGILLNEIKECYKTSPCLAIAYQAIVFFVLHIILSGKYSFYLFLVGIITGVFCFYTSSLLYGLVFHICNNIIALILSTSIINFDKLKIDYFSIFFINVVLLCATFLFFSIFIKRMKRKIITVEYSEALCNTASKPE